MRREIVATWAFAAAAATAFAGAVDGEYQLFLTEALFQGDKPGPIRPNLVLELERTRGTWKTVTGMSLRYNQGDHFGVVEEAEATARKLRLKLVITVGSDTWVPGGIARFDVDLSRNADSKLAGTYRGTFKDQELTGQAFGEHRPTRAVRLKGYKPLDPIERPRLLFRKHQIPALREKLRTPLGRAYLARAEASGDMVSLGVLYQLTGEADFADRARQALAAMEGNFGPDPGGAGSGGVGHKFVAAALAYDLCYEAWPAEFREAIDKRMMRYITFFQKVLPISFANYHPCSNYYGPGRGSMAIGSLAVYGDKGAKPVKPPSPDEMLKAGGFQAMLLKQSGEIDKLRNKYAEALARWKAEHLAWAESGGGDRAKLHAFHAGRMHMLRHYRLGVGEGGFQAETGGYAGIATWYPLVYANLYFHMFGKDASPADDINVLMVRKMMQQVFLDGDRQRTRHQKLSTSADFRPAWIAAGFPITPDRYQPGLLWAWNHVAGVTGPDSTDAVIGCLDPKARGLDLAMAFLHYPLDVKPVHPSQCMPLNWQARSFGFYLFRDGWKGGDDFIAQVFLKAQPVGGWNHPNAGTFRLMGLGHYWNTGSDSRNGVREQENVVLLSDDEVRNDCARLTHVDFAKDGSGTVTMDLNDLYGGRRTVKVRSKITTKQVPGGGTIKVGGELVDRELPLRDGQGFRMADRWVDSGLTGLRAIAVDYSGASGAPCLMAVLDRIAGGGRKVWMWQVPAPEERRGEAPKVAVSGNTFTISYSDAFLKATVVSPAAARIVHETKRIEIGTARHGFHGEVNRILVTGADPKNGEFLVIVTVQRKDAPAVTAEGKGLGAIVAVGGQKLRFDDRKIVLGP